MSDETYNGWTNKPTWLVKIWIDNDQSTNESALDMARNHDNAANLAETLSEWVAEDIIPELPASLASDLLTYSLAVVNWDEIARAYLEDVSDGIPHVMLTLDEQNAIHDQNDSL